MIEFRTVGLIAQKELRAALRNRWFVMFTVAFIGLALVLTSLLQPANSPLRIASYSRTTASLINLVLLFVPLVGLTLGATNLVGDRETGVLAYLLAQPVTREEVLLGKFTGLGAALIAAIALGFGVAGLVLAAQGTAQSAGAYVLSVVLAGLLALAMLSVGFLLATLAGTTSAALGAGLLAWLGLVFVGDLGIMGTAVATQMPLDVLFFTAVVNPLQMYKIAAILTIQANLEVLGPAGLYATDVFGPGLLPLLVGGLLLWIVFPLAAALVVFSRQEKLGTKAGAK
ncbi:MAG: ABC transporter permease subunit [Anaerolineae bacterium]